MPRKRPDQTEDDPSTTTTLRLRQSEFDEIGRRARALRMTRTDYMIRKALGQPTGDESYDQRLADLEGAVRRLEQLNSLG